MRQIFSSPRLENVEALADLLREAGIQTHITDGRSYKGKRRQTFRYTDKELPKPALWVVNASDQPRAREILRGAGLLASTRPGTASAHELPLFRTQQAEEAGRMGKKITAKIRMALLGAIVLVVAVYYFSSPGPRPATQTTSGVGTSPKSSRVAQPASAAAISIAKSEPAKPPFDGGMVPTPAAVVRAVLEIEIADVALPVACLSVDGRDATAQLTAVLEAPGRDVVQASQCVRVADSDRGSYRRSTGRPATLLEVSSFRPSAPDRAEVHFSEYQHRLWDRYKIYEVRLVDGEWKVTQVLKHVSMQG